MRGHLDVADVFVILRVDNSDFSVVLSSVLTTVADIDQLGIWFVDNSVGPRIKLDRIEQLKRVPSKHADHCVVAACQKQLVELRDVRCALRLLESGNAPRPFSRSQIHDFKGAILQPGQKKTLALDVDLHVIETAFHIWDRNSLNEPQGLSCAFLGNCERGARKNANNYSWKLERTLV